MFMRSYLSRPVPRTPQAHEVEHQRFEKLEGIIKAAPKWTVNAVVWNMLLKQAGASKRYNKMFDLYNDVSQTSAVDLSMPERVAECLCR